MKEKIRRKIKDIRDTMQKEEVLEKSNQIKKRLFQMKKFNHAHTILFYISYDNEVYTHDMIKETLSKDKKVVVPVTDVKKRKLILSELKNWGDLTLGTYGILEPLEDRIQKVSPEDIDIIITPGVAFDEYGHRIGHGMAYYDNLLKNMSKNLVIGLAFEFQIMQNIPTESHDIPVDMIITEKRIINCSK